MKLAVVVEAWNPVPERYPMRSLRVDIKLKSVAGESNKNER